MAKAKQTWIEKEINKLQKKMLKDIERQEKNLDRAIKKELKRIKSGKPVKFQGLYKIAKLTNG